MFDFLEFFNAKPAMIWSAAILAFLKAVVEKYLFSDWQFLYFLLVIIFLDTALGVWKNLKTKTLSSRGFAGFFEKITLYAVFLIVTHVLVSFKIADSQLPVFAWIDDVFYSAIIVREIISVIENIGAIKPDLIPAWILAYLKKFDTSGKLTDLQNPSQNGTTTH